MSLQSNKELVATFLDQVYNKGNLAYAYKVVSPAYVSHNEFNMAVLGPEGIKNAAAMQRTAFPDLVTYVDDLIAEGDKVVVRGHDEGTHTGAPFMGIAPTGRHFAITWIDIFRIKDGMLVEAWLAADLGRFVEQLVDPDERSNT